MALALCYPKLKKLYFQKYDWQLSQIDNVEYLFERYLRLQSTINIMQSEIQDLKSIFKIYFEKGGEDITANTGEILTYNHKKTFGYDFSQIKDTLEEIGALTKAVKLNNAFVDRLVMGNGTDLLVSDDPLDMAVIKTCVGLSAMSLTDDGIIEAECGALLSKIAAFSLSNSLAGFEFAQGIPGSLGGGLSMNAGAYGGELKDVLLSVTAADEAGNEVELSLDDCLMSYRRSVFTEGKLTALSARLKLAPGDQEEIRGRIEELAEKRKASQPLNLPSAGSTFKRPVGGFAAALIDQAGLKGYTVGGAQVSEKHAGFVVNIGGATCRDVLMLMEHIRETVLRESGIALEPEVKIIR